VTPLVWHPRRRHNPPTPQPSVDGNRCCRAYPHPLQPVTARPCCGPPRDHSLCRRRAGNVAGVSRSTFRFPRTPRRFRLRLWSGSSPRCILFRRHRYNSRGPSPVKRGRRPRPARSLYHNGVSIRTPPHGSSPTGQPPPSSAAPRLASPPPRLRYGPPVRRLVTRWPRTVCHRFRPFSSRRPSTHGEDVSIYFLDPCGNRIGTLTILLLALPAFSWPAGDALQRTCVAQRTSLGSMFFPPELVALRRSSTPRRRICRSPSCASCREADQFLRSGRFAASSPRPLATSRYSTRNSYTSVVLVTGGDRESAAVMRAVELGGDG